MGPRAAIAVKAVVTNAPRLLRRYGLIRRRFDGWPTKHALQVQASGKTEA